MVEIVMIESLITATCVFAFVSELRKNDMVGVAVIAVLQNVKVEKLFIYSEHSMPGPWSC